MVNAAIVGLGWWGRRMVEAVQNRADRIRFTHAVERDPAKCASFAMARGLTMLGSLEEVLVRQEVDVVVLATPHSLHVEQIIACASAGKAVFSEKPLALTLSDAQRAVAACDHAGVALGLGTDRRFLPAMRALKDIVAGDHLGKLLHVEAQYANDAMSQGLSGGWRSDPAEAPGAGVTGPGLHALDALIHLAGPVAGLAGQIHRPEGPAIPLDAVSLMLRFRSGASGLLGCVRGVPDYFRMSVFGAGGWAEMRGWGTLEVRRSGEDEILRTYDPALAVGDLLVHFADAVEQRSALPVSIASMLNTVAAFETAIAAFGQDGLLDVPGPF